MPQLAYRSAAILHIIAIAPHANKWLTGQLDTLGLGSILYTAIARLQKCKVDRL